MSGKPSKIAGVKGLFDPRLSSRQAVQRFLASCQKKPPRHLVRLNNAVHTAVFAPTGAGKGVSLVIPHLLTWRDSCVVVDFKGENYRITSDARKRMGQRVVRLDPFKVCGDGSDSYNALDGIDPESPAANDECSSVANAFVIRTGLEKDPHFPDMAETWIGALTAAVVAFAEPEDRNLQTVRTLLTNPAKMQATIEMMCASDKWEGMLARRGHELTNSKDKELASTLTTTNRFMHFLDTVMVSKNTKKSSFDPAELLTGKMTIYLILPPEHIRTQSALLRLWIGSLLRTVMRGGLQETNKVNFICDEANSLGKMDQISDILAIGRGYGIRLQLYYQDCGQLKKCWPDGTDQTLLANTTQIFFGVNDQTTAEYVSNRLGEKTIIVTSGGSGDGTSEQRSHDGKGSSSSSRNNNYNWAQHGRKLLKPEEVAALPERVAITFTPGVRPLATWLARYYEPDFKKAIKHSSGMGLWRASLDTACLFLSAAMVAVLFTGVFLKEGKVKHVEEFFRAAQERGLRRRNHTARPLLQQNPERDRHGVEAHGRPGQP
jgi:type IV secretion system protein VirD4